VNKTFNDNWLGTPEDISLDKEIKRQPDTVTSKYIVDHFTEDTKDLLEQSNRGSRNTNFDTAYRRICYKRRENIYN
jgi:hypothetical protein